MGKKGTIFVKNILRVFAKIFVFAKMFAKYTQDSRKCERQNEKMSWGWKNLNYIRKICAKMGIFERFSKKWEYLDDFRQKLCNFAKNSIFAKIKKCFSFNTRKE